MTTAIANNAVTAPRNATIRAALLAIVTPMHTILRGGMVAILVSLVVGVAFWITGYEANRVVSGSMESTIMVGDQVITRPFVPEDLQEGAVLSYRNGSMSVTHRVIAVQDGSATMKGDHNEVADPALITEDDVLGTVFFVIDREHMGILIAGFVALVLLFAAFAGLQEAIEKSLRRRGR